jgi:alkylation response protein AidB-like acyl-CoA dehydrogenase
MTANTMTSAQSEVARAVAEILSRSADSAAHTEDAASGQWHSFVEAGLPWAAVPQLRGGPGGSVHDAAAILREVGRAAASVPAGETDLLGEWLLACADMPSPSALLAVAPGGAGDDLRLQRRGDSVILSGTAGHVPWASASERFVALVTDGIDNHVVSVAMRRLTVSPRVSLACEARDSVSAKDIHLSSDEVRPLPRLQQIDLRARGAAIRTLLIRGAVDTVVDLAQTHCTARNQFGRRLRDFQVVAHQLALLREYAALMTPAAVLAVGVLNGSGSWEEAATAKIVAGEVATQVAKSAHQMHGAIGVSEEYSLQRFTRRLWAWRDEYGGEHEWASRLGEALAARRADALWPWMTQTSASV